LKPKPGGFKRYGSAGFKLYRGPTMKGMSRNAAKGTRRNTSAVVRVICRRSRRVVAAHVDPLVNANFEQPGFSLYRFKG
jgi:hypothetical protein